MSSEHDDNPASHVTKAECLERMSGVKEELKTIREALVGKDMRHGLVKDVADLKKERSTTIEVLKAVVVPIIVAVVTALIISHPW